MWASLGLYTFLKNQISVALSILAVFSAGHWVQVPPRSPRRTVLSWGGGMCGEPLCPQCEGLPEALHVLPLSLHGQAGTWRRTASMLSEISDWRAEAQPRLLLRDLRSFQGVEPRLWTPGSERSSTSGLLGVYKGPWTSFLQPMPALLPTRKKQGGSSQGYQGAPGKPSGADQPKVCLQLQLKHMPRWSQFQQQDCAETRDRRLPAGS